MSRRGENIRKRKDGRWEGRLPIYNKQNKIEKYHSVYAYSYQEVKALMKENKGIYIAENTIPDTAIQKICNNWLEDIKIYIKQSTHSRYNHIVQKHILPYFENITANNLTDDDITAFIRNKTINGRLDKKSGLAPKTIQDICTVLKQIIKYANKKGYCRQVSLDFQKPKSEPQPFSVLSVEEQIQFVSYLKRNINLETLGILICLYTGIRVGELCALTWNDIDMTHSVLHINKTLQRVQNTEDNTSKTKIIIDKPKSNKSIRDIPIPQFLYQLLKRFNFKYQNNAYLLTGQTNHFIEPRLFQYKFKAHLKKAGLQDRNIHALRHTFATRAVEQNMDIKTLSEILGHSTVKFTLERYVYSSYELKVQSMEKMAACF